MALECFDAIVVGGGPAGSAAALALARRGCATVLVERSSYEQLRVGETLPPAIRRPLAELGAWERFLDVSRLPSYSIRCAWATPEPSANDTIYNPYGNGWHVNRAAFDAMLAQSAEDAGATVLRSTRLVSVSGAPGEVWRLDVSRGGVRHTLRGRMLLDATGRKALLARRLGAKAHAKDRLIGVAAILPACETGCWTLIEAVEDGWWYSAPLPESRMIVAFMTDADMWVTGQKSTAQYWTDRLRAATHTASRAGAIGELAHPHIVSAASLLLRPGSGPGWIATGDAVLAFDPLSGQGVYKALNSGLRAAEAVALSLDGDAAAFPEYERWIEESFAHYLHQRAHFYGSAPRWRDSTFWQRRCRPQLLSMSSDGATN